MSDNWIQVYGGIAFDLDNPDPKTITIENIAHSLSMLCRFGGHCNRFYSVAEHSVHCYDQANDKDKKEALLHDGTEAFVVDLVTPVKLMLPEYKKLEDRIDLVIRSKFGLPESITPQVKKIDRRMLMTEKQQLMDKAPRSWDRTDNPYSFELPCWSPDQAKEEFLKRWDSMDK